MKVQAEASREFWRAALVAGGFTAIPRWSLDPAMGVAVHEAKVPEDLVAMLRGLAEELGVSFSSVLLAAHAKVLAVLSGEREVATGYIGGPGHGALPCRLTTESDSWRELLLDSYRVEAQLLWYADFPLDELKRELGVTGPAFETVLDLTGDRWRPFWGRGVVGRHLGRGWPVGVEAAVPDGCGGCGWRSADCRLSLVGVGVDGC